ncbi:MAG TPA: GNAT family N-acetyltransferase [Gaiellaceae bacterium]|nr:GNAT family N-acetyltransferase [Gaiellaceae bacterium]
MFGYIPLVVTIRSARIEDAPELARIHHESSEAHTRSSLLLIRLAWLGARRLGARSSRCLSARRFVLYVHPDWWGTEAGQRLLDRAHEELAREYEQAVLTVLAANARARRFYERNGWRLDRVKIEPHFGGRQTEVALYRKRFGPTA